MTLRQRLALHYGVVGVIALSVLSGLIHHEFATERRLRSLLPADRQGEAGRGDAAEVAVYSAIPLLLVEAGGSRGDRSSR